MSTTAKDVIQAAIGRRTANDPDVLASTKELIRFLDRKVKAVYVEVAGVQPLFFGASAAMTPDGTKWDRPSDAIVVPKLESSGDAGNGDDAVLTAGDKVSIVPLQDSDADIAPRVYQLGSSFYSVGETGDPSASTNGDELTAYYAKRHPDLDPDQDPDHANNTLDATWRDDHSDLLIAHMARYLAVKDGRGGDEIAELEEEIEDRKAALLTEARLYDLGVSARHAGGIHVPSTGPA